MILCDKYRPRTFSQVVGQQVAVSALRKIASADAIAVRSIFLRGPYGTGKTTLARVFARALNCETFKATGEVCGTCAACKDVESCSSMLYKELDASQAGNVESIRGLAESLSVAPHGRRLIVIDEIHAASTQALNCLLKLVEDGVRDTIFMFCSTEDILPTLKSRSLCLDITPVPHEAMVEHIRGVALAEGIDISKEQTDALCAKSQGHVRDAMQLLQHFSMAGDAALASSYSTLREFLLCTLSFTPAADPQELLSRIMQYPISDIKDSVARILRGVLSPDGSDQLLAKLSAKGAGTSFFAFFFSPIAQQAFGTEVGTELLLRSFYEKYHPKQA